jgi:hypothetical protein
MAQQPDYEDVPVWDRWLWWCNKGRCADKYYRSSFREILKRKKFSYIYKPFAWTSTDEGDDFWASLDDKWFNHVVKINHRGARSEA